MFWRKRSQPAPESAFTSCPYCHHLLARDHGRFHCPHCGKLFPPFVRAPEAFAAFERALRAAEDSALLASDPSDSDLENFAQQMRPIREGLWLEFVAANYQ